MSKDPVSPFGDLDDLLQSIRDVERELDTASDDFVERIRLREELRELKAMRRAGASPDVPALTSLGSWSI